MHADTGVKLLRGAFKSLNKKCKIKCNIFNKKTFDIAHSAGFLEFIFAFVTSERETSFCQYAYLKNPCEQPAGLLWSRNPKTMSLERGI